MVSDTSSLGSVRQNVSYPTQQTSINSVLLESIQKFGMWNSIRGFGKVNIDHSDRFLSLDGCSPIIKWLKEVCSSGKSFKESMLSFSDYVIIDKKCHLINDDPLHDDVGQGWPNMCTLCPWEHPNPQFVAQNCEIFLSTFQHMWDLCWTKGCFCTSISVQLHDRYSVPFWQSSVVRYRSSAKSSSLCQSCRWSLTEVTAHFLLENLYKYVLHVIPFLNEGVKSAMYLRSWKACLSTNRDAIMTLH